MPKTILTTILTNNTNNLIPCHTISQIIPFTAVPFNSNLQIASLTHPDPTHITSIMTFIETHIPSTKTTHLLHLPPLPASTNTKYPTNCCMKQCPLYNMGCKTKITNFKQFIHDVNKHGNAIHRDLFLTTASQTLKKIRWYKCSPSCNTLHFTEHILTTHQQQCEQYILTMSTTPTQSPPNNTNSQTLPHTILFDSCPTQYHSQLQSLLDNNTNQSTLYATVFCWNAIANTASTHQSP